MDEDDRRGRREEKMNEEEEKTKRKKKRWELQKWTIKWSERGEDGEVYVWEEVKKKKSLEGELVEEEGD